MTIYKDLNPTRILDLSDSGNLVKIKMDCIFGTMASVNFKHINKKSVTCGKTADIGTVDKLKGLTIEFNGEASNPDNKEIKVIHTIYEGNGNSTSYIFPHEYNGMSAFDPSDEHPDYKFFVKFR